MTTYPEVMPHSSLGMLIILIKLVSKHVPAMASDSFIATWMSHNPRPVKTEQVTQDMVNRSVVSDSGKAIDPAPTNK